ncbi:MAG: phosphoheptose isomerase [Nitrospirae bacterium RBG_16_64_22]|nr:MAG: phosphoheptose isomerase [Nitrospirae bacterium RBG_16_64_22]
MTIEQIFEESAKVKQAFAASHADRIAQAVETIVAAFRKGNKVLLFGNGGSATDASHIAGEFVNRFMIERPGLPAVALVTDMAVLTSISNDYAYEEIFSRQIKTLGAPGDVAIGISTSGNSANVIKGMKAAKSGRLTTIAFTGGKGGKLAGLADIAFVVPSTSVPRIQETHITLGHAICQLVDQRLFGVVKK